MFYSVDGKIVQVGGAFPERRVNTLTFQVEGRHFPKSYYNFENDTNIINGNELIEIRSSQPNSVIINYGDGTVVIKEFVNVGSYYRIRYNLSDETEVSTIPQHEFTDGFLGRRNITFEFEFPQNVTSFLAQFIQLNGSLPNETLSFLKLNVIVISFASFIETIPNSFPKNLENFSTANSLLNKNDLLQDTLFSSSLKKLALDGSFNLSDNISSGFFKINQLSNTLEDLRINNCDIVQLPSEISELFKLRILFCEFNKFTTIPKEIESLSNLVNLSMGSLVDIDNVWPDFSNLSKLTSLFLRFRNTDFSNIVNHLAPLVRMTVFIGAGAIFRFSVINTQVYDSLINGLYQLSTLRAYKNGDTIPSDEDFPFKFRNFIIGDSSRSYSGFYQQPSGFIQDEANGNPTTPAEKAFVLVNNYGYTITSEN